jgi:hypothetical protein
MLKDDEKIVEAFDLLTGIVESTTTEKEAEEIHSLISQLRDFSDARRKMLVQKRMNKQSMGRAHDAIEVARNTLEASLS